jgi:small subunit ribosomal protein S7e
LISKEIAENFKENGNEYFKGKRFRDALGFYTQGIDAKPTDLAIQEALLCNRAACNLELSKHVLGFFCGVLLIHAITENYGAVLRDCSKALTINPNSSKAYYRSSLALLALDRVDEALDCCNRCLEFDKDNKSMLSVRERIVNAKIARDRIDRERSERLRKEQELEGKLNAAFQVRVDFNMHYLIHDPDRTESR